MVGAGETDSGAVTIDTVNTGEGMTTGSVTVTVGAVVAVVVVSGAGDGSAVATVCRAVTAGSVTVVGAEVPVSGDVTADAVTTGEEMATGSATVTVGAVVAVAVVSGAGGGGGGAGGSMVVLSTDVTGPSANWLSVEIPTCEADAANAGTVGSSNVKPINNAATREKIYIFVFIWTSFRSYILKVMLNLLGRVGVAGR